MKTRRYLLLIATALLIVPASFAQTLFWDGGTANLATNGDGISQGSVGTWDNATQNWDQGSGLAHIAWGSGDNAVFAAPGIAPGAGVVTLGAAINANSLTINTTNYIFTDGGTTANTLTVNSITNGQNTTISNNLVNTTTLTKAGAGTLNLLAPSTGLTGSLNVNAGTLTLGSSSVLGQTGPLGFSSATLATNSTFRVFSMNNVSNAVNLAQVISGGGGVSIQGSNYSSYIAFSGASTFTGPFTVNQCALLFNSINDSSPCSVGNGTNFTIATSSSTTSANYIGTGDTTARALTIGGSTASTSLNVNGSGALVWNGPLLFTTTNQHTLTLGGNTTAVSVFAGVIGDGTITNTIVTKSGNGNWLLTGSNTYSGWTLMQGGALYITNDFNLGASNGPLSFTTTSTIKSTNDNVTFGTYRTVNINPNITANFTVSDTNNLNVAAFLTGPGYVQKAGSSFSLGTVRFSNTNNNFAGTMTISYGNTEFTSVANAGTPCSFGLGTTNSGIIAINNTASSGTLRYVGAGNSATTRALNLNATTATYQLDCTNTAGTIAFLNTGTLITGAGVKTFTITGSNTGTNTLAQVINDNGGATTVTKTGAGQWVLAGTNTYTGGTVISGGGTLTVSQDANLGAVPGSVVATNVVVNGSILNATTGFTLNTNRGVILGSVGSAVNGVGTFSVGSGQTLTVAGVVASGGGSGTGALVKTGPGTLALSGSDTYNGNTTVNAGTLALTGTGSIAASPVIILDTNTTFDVTGVSGGYTLASTQTLDLTNRPSPAVTVNGSLNLGSATVNLLYTNGTPSATVTGGTLTLNSGEAITITVTNGGNPLPTGSYKLIAKGSGGSVAGTPPSAFTIATNSYAAGDIASLVISGGELYLQIASPVLYPPVLSGVGLSGTNAILTFSGTNGQPYSVLTTTNLLLPVTNWTVLGTGTLNGATMTYTNTSATNAQQFYLIESQ